MYSSVNERVASSMLEKEIKDDRRRGSRGGRGEGDCPLLEECLCAARNRAVAVLAGVAVVEAAAVVFATEGGRGGGGGESSLLSVIMLLLLPAWSDVAFHGSIASRAAVSVQRMWIVSDVGRFFRESSIIIIILTIPSSTPTCPSFHAEDQTRQSTGNNGNSQTLNCAKVGNCWQIQVDHSSTRSRSHHQQRLRVLSHPVISTSTTSGSGRQSFTGSGGSTMHF